MKKPKIIAFSNQKGGVGKTTCTREIGIYLASVEKKVLLVDTDPQANLTKSLSDYEINPGLYEALTEPDCETRRINDNLSILAGSVKLALLEKSLVGELDAYTRLKELLQNDNFKEYDYILIDTPPSLGVLTINALTCSDFLIVPMSPSFYSMQGTNDLMVTVAKIKKNLNPNLSLLGVIINCFDTIPLITRQIKDEIVRSFKDKVFSTVISKSIKIEEAIIRKTGIIFVKTKVTDEIKIIGDELQNRLEGCDHGE